MAESDNTSSHKASVYDRNVRPAIPFYDEIHRQAIDLVRTVHLHANTWLDAGCGIGYLVELALPILAQTRFILTDALEEMLQQAMLGLKEAPSQRLKFLHSVRNEQLSLHQLGVVSQVVTSISCHHYLQARERHEAVRGRVATCWMRVRL